MNRPFSLLIKPASADCNLRCRYCFYLEKKALYPQVKRHRMPDDVLERLVRGYMSTYQPIYSFGWQGGEPTLMGAEFFKKVVEYQRKFGRPNAIAGNGLQTNATLIDDRLANVLADNRFLVGCSLDGPPDVHNQYRRTTDDNGTHDRVLRGVDLLKKNRVEYNILVLVSQSNVRKASEIYHYLVNNGHYFHQYIPCVEFDGDGRLQPYSITGEEWGRFLCEIYDEWIKKDVYRVSIRLFDSILNKKVDGVSTVCTMNDDCRSYFVVEYNGDIYPCDFFVEKELKLGNIMDDSWEDLLNSSVYGEFGRQKKQWNSQCSTCGYLSLCRGDCLKHRLAPGKGPGHLSLLCDGWKFFFEYTEKGFNKLAGDVKKQRLQMRLTGRTNPRKKSGRSDRIGRNDPCPCGSGLKYKKCCGG